MVSQEIIDETFLQPPVRHPHRRRRRSTSETGRLHRQSAARAARLPENARRRTASVRARPAPMLHRHLQHQRAARVRRSELRRDRMADVHLQSGTAQPHPRPDRFATIARRAVDAHPARRERRRDFRSVSLVHIPFVRHAECKRRESLECQCRRCRAERFADHAVGTERAAGGVGGQDRGIAWLCKGTFQQQSRRGQELALWGVFDAQNYDFIIDYRLRDDGSLSFRLGATGFNNPYFPPESTTDAHMHSALWRADVDLNGSGGDSAKTLSHNEGPTSLLAQDGEEPFNGGFEGTMVWDPLRFLTVAIED